MYKMGVLHAPNLKTVIMVEQVLAGMKKSVVTVAELKKMLPKQVNHYTLRVILEYLEASNKIAVSLRGISWIANDNANLKKAIAKGLEL
ncbi:MAG: hypothetical protein V1787_05975 [Candidatus Micrarchaeota archaeon]